MSTKQHRAAFFTDQQKNVLLGLLSILAVFAVVLALPSYGARPLTSHAGWLSQVNQQYTTGCSFSSLYSRASCAPSVPLEVNTPNTGMLPSTEGNGESAGDAVTVQGVALLMPERQTHENIVVSVSSENAQSMVTGADGVFSLRVNLAGDRVVHLLASYTEPGNIGLGSRLQVRYRAFNLNFALGETSKNVTIFVNRIQDVSF